MGRSGILGSRLGGPTRGAAGRSDERRQRVRSNEGDAPPGRSASPSTASALVLESAWEPSTGSRRGKGS